MAVGTRIRTWLRTRLENFFRIGLFGRMLAKLGWTTLASILS